jgi:hypothetical protein
MKLCPQCASSPLPFIMIAVIAGVVGFLTWLMLGLSELDLGLRVAIAAGGTAAVAVTLWHYVVSCMRRHCRHSQHNTVATSEP